MSVCFPTRYYASAIAEAIVIIYKVDLTSESLFWVPPCRVAGPRLYRLVQGYSGTMW